MDKSTYSTLFETAIERAYERAGFERVGSEPVVDFYGRPFRAAITLQQALDLLWLSPNRHYRVVGVAMFEGEQNPSVLYVRVSKHPPGEFSETFNPTDLGPFKVMAPVKRWKAERGT